MCQGSTLQHYILCNHTKITIEDVQICLKQLVNGLQVLNEKNILHRDLKPENILLKNNKSIEKLIIADFGLSIQKDQQSVNFTKTGTPAYIAPEIFKSSSQRVQYDQSCDIFSLGIILHQMIFNQYPGNLQKSILQQQDYNQIASNILQKNQRFYVDFDYYIYRSIQFPEIIDLINQMIDSNPKTRITLDEIQNHPFFDIDGKDVKVKYDLKNQNKYKTKNNNNQSSSIYQKPVFKKQTTIDKLQEKISQHQQKQLEKKYFKSEQNINKNKNNQNTENCSNKNTLKTEQQETLTQNSFKVNNNVCQMDSINTIELNGYLKNTSSKNISLCITSQNNLGKQSLNSSQKPSYYASQQQMEYNQKNNSSENISEKIGIQYESSDNINRSQQKKKSQFYRQINKPKTMQPKINISTFNLKNYTNKQCEQQENPQIEAKTENNQQAQEVTMYSFKSEKILQKQQIFEQIEEMEEVFNNEDNNEGHIQKIQICEDQKHYSSKNIYFPNI